MKVPYMGPDEITKVAEAAKGVTPARIIHESPDRGGVTQSVWADPSSAAIGNRRGNYTILFAPQWPVMIDACFSTPFLLPFFCPYQLQRTEKA